MRTHFYFVKIPKELIPHIDRVVESTKDSFGLRRFRSRNDFVTEAVKHFLREFLEQGGGDGGEVS